MFDIGWQELFIVVAIVIIVVGPRDLPRVLKTVTSYIGKIRSMVREFQSGIDEVTREVDLEDLKVEAQKLAEVDFDDEIKQATNPVKAIEDEFSFDNGDVGSKDKVDSVSENTKMEELSSASLALKDKESISKKDSDK